MSKLKFGTILVFLVFFKITFGQQLEITQLKIDQRSTPLGFDNPVPEFSWIIQSIERVIVQSAYEIMVGTGEIKLQKGQGNIWKSGHNMPSKSFTVLFMCPHYQNYLF
jgi:alpha-L-rhamnosidase